MDDRQRQINIGYVREHLDEALNLLKELKPEERSELSRNYAVAITDLEKLIAYVWFYIELDDVLNGKDE